MCLEPQKADGSGSKVTANTCTLVPADGRVGEVCRVSGGCPHREAPVHVPSGGHGQGDVKGQRNVNLRH